MQTKDIIKKYQLQKRIKGSDPETQRVYKALYEAVDIKLKEAESTLNKTLVEITKLVAETIRRVNEYTKTLTSGKDYILTDADKFEIAGKVKISPIEKVIEKIEVIKEQPIVHETIKEITKFVENKDTPDQIVSKVNSAESKILISSIKNLREELDNLRKLSRETKRGGSSGGGMGNTQHESKNLTSATTSVATTYTIAAGGYALWVYYQGQMVARGVGYTVASDRKTLNLLFTPVDGTFLDLIYIR